MRKLNTLLCFICCITYGFSQQITGKVLNQENQPIVNALVSISANENIWTKTDENGDFTLAGEVSDKLVAAALGYETIKDYSLTSTENIEIILEEDPLLSSDVYHISFDHLRPGDYYSVEELKDDFIIAYGKGFYDGSDEASNRAAVDKSESVDPDGTSLKVKYPKGKLKTSDSGVDTRVYLSGNYKTGKSFTADELYFSYWVKFSDNFDFKCGGKMPSLGGEFENSDNGDNERWKGRTMWRNGGSIQFYPELPHGEDKFEHDSLRFWGEKEYDGGDICTNEFTSYLTNGEWHNIELHYVLEKDGKAGWFEGWVDGDKEYKIINSEAFGFYRRPGEGLDNLTLNFIMISTFFGGSSVEYEPDEDVYAWYDEFRVSAERINEYDKYANNVITASEHPSVIEQFSIYPNPTTGMLNLSEEVSWKILNLQGEELAEGIGETVNIEILVSGVYLLAAKGKVHKVMKQ